MQIMEYRLKNFALVLDIKIIQTVRLIALF